MQLSGTRRKAPTGGRGGLRGVGDVLRINAPRMLLLQRGLGGMRCPCLVLGLPGRTEISPPSTAVSRLSRLFIRSSVLIQAHIPSFIAAFPNYNLLDYSPARRALLAAGYQFRFHSRIDPLHSFLRDFFNVTWGKQLSINVSEIRGGWALSLGHVSGLWCWAALGSGQRC